jgi:hypothetical protein
VAHCWMLCACRSSAARLPQTECRCKMVERRMLRSMEYEAHPMLLTCAVKVLQARAQLAAARQLACVASSALTVFVTRALKWEGANEPCYHQQA